MLEKRKSFTGSGAIRLCDTFTSPGCIEKINQVLDDNKIPCEYYEVAYIILLGALYYKTGTRKGSNNTEGYEFPYQDTVRRIFNGKLKFSDMCPGEWKDIRNCLYYCTGESHRFKWKKGTEVSEYREKYRLVELEVDILDAAHDFYMSALRRLDKPLCQWKPQSPSQKTYKDAEGGEQT